jgi:hypothetical protein
VRRVALLAMIVTAPSLGCAAQAWQPPPPAGVTYEYEYQGFSQKTRGGYGGVGGNVALGGAFSFRKHSELHGKEGADPFAQSAPIDGIQFNEHLAGRGIPLMPVAPPAPAAAKP